MNRETFVRIARQAVLPAAFAIVNLLMFTVLHMHAYAVWKSQFAAHFYIRNERTDLVLNVVLPAVDHRTFVLYLTGTNLLLGILFQLHSLPRVRRAAYFAVWLIPLLWYGRMASYGALKLVNWPAALEQPKGNAATESAMPSAGS